MVGVFDVIKWRYDMKLSTSVELVTSHYVLSHALDLSHNEGHNNGEYILK